VIYTEQLIPLGLILNELITNSIEHGFIGKQEGDIHFHLSSNTNKEIKIIIGDNGIGINNEKESFREGSIGIELVNIFVEQLNGTLNRIGTDGTVYELIFKQN